MNENKTKNLSVAVKIGLLVCLIIVVALILGCAKHVTDQEKVTKKNSSYSSSVTSTGEMTYTHTDEKGNQTPVTAEQMAEDLSIVLKEYITGDEEYVNEKIQYLMGAETVTKMPYIDPEEGQIPEDTGEESDTEEDENEESPIELEGQIKFYRYENGSESTEENKVDVELKEEDRIKYVQPDIFEEKLQAYRDGNDPEGELFKFFTIDEEGNVVIAYGTKETRSVTTGGDGLADQDLTTEIVNEISGETYNGDYASGFGLEKYTAFTKPIDYLSLVEQYVMPSNLLYSLLIQTGDIKFVEAIASLAYENEIAIAIYDNNSFSTTTQTYTYIKEMEMKGTIKLNLDDIQTSEPDMPAVNSALISTSYPYLIEKCEFETNTDGKIQYREHTYGYRGDVVSGWKNPEQDYVLYVEDINNSNQITNLVSKDNAGKFTTKFYQETNAKSAPTVGVILADTWVAKWTATYLKEDDEGHSQPDNGEINEAVVATYEDSNNEILNIFSDGYRGQIEEGLANEEEKLKQNAIDIIDEATDYTVGAENVSVTIYESEKKDILEKNVRGGCKLCTDLVKARGFENALIDTIYEATVNESGVLYSLHVGVDYRADLAKYKGEKEAEARREAEREAAERAGERKADFRDALDEQIEPDYHTVKGKKIDTSITFDSNRTRNSSTHKRYETTEIDEEMEGAGEKFSKVFNEGDFYKSKEALLMRDTWFWEYIRENEDTAKLEDVLKYLLNIATESEDFGTFSDDEIKNLLLAFKPAELKNASSSSGYLYTFAEWLKSYENEPLRRYVNGDESYYDDVQKYVGVNEEDGSLYGKMYFTENDGCWNYTYGIMVYDSSGNLNNKDYFAAYGLDLDSLVAEALNEGEARVPMETLDQIYMDLIKDKKEALVKEVEEEIVDPGNPDGETIKMETWQYYALTSVCYQWGNCGQYISGDNNIAKVYKKYYIDQENPEEFRNSAVCETSSGRLAYFFNDKYVVRQNATWTMFNEGRFILSDGTEIYASRAGEVAEFALQFEGLTAPNVRTEDDPPGGLFEYYSSDGEQFWADEWCAMFVSYCFDKCGLIESIDGTYFGCTTKLNSIRSTELFQGPDYVPSPGDVILYTDDGGISAEHTGIVVSCDGTKIITVEGNMSAEDDYSSVVKVTDWHTVGASDIAGYIVPREE